MADGHELPEVTFRWPFDRGMYVRIVWDQASLLP
jgi:hypothetical protein